MEIRTLKFNDLVLIGIILLAPYLLYSIVFSYPYVSFDDSIHIYRNEVYSPFAWKKIGAIWLNLKNGLYVPVAYSVWGLFIQLLGLTVSPLEQSASWFHGLNLALHSANGALVFLIIRGYVTRSLPAFLGSFIFLVHPLQVESFAWISSFDGLLATFFGLLACIYWNRYLSGGLSRHYLFFLVLAFLSLLSKPSAVSWPFIFLSFVWFQEPKRFWSGLLRLTPVFGLASLIVILTRLGQPEHQLRFVTPMLQRPIVIADSFLFYLEKVFLPMDLTVNYGRTPDSVLKNPWSFFKLGFLISLFYLFFRLKLSRIYRLGILLFVCSLIPNLGFFPFNFQKYSSVADRYAYVAVFGFALCMAKWVQDRRGMATGLCGILVVAIFSVLSTQQLKYWKSDTLLVYKMAASAPNFYHHSNLAQMLWTEMLGKRPLPMLAPQPISIPITEKQLAGRIAEIKFHLLQALKFKPEDKGTQKQLYEFMLVYGDYSIRENGLAELRKLESKFYKDSTVELRH